MSNYHICSLYSGSSGNAILIDAAGTRILIDAGKSARALCTALCAVGSDIRNIDAIFVTHEHSDHVSALEMISKKYKIPVHMTEASAGKMPAGDFLRGVVVTHTPLFSVKVGALSVTSFPTSHDSVCSVGYRIEFEDEDGKHSLGLATDTGYVTDCMGEGLDGCEAVIIECNHDLEMLRLGPYPFQLKERILSHRGHLSNDACAAFASKLAYSGTHHILLAHLSRDNNAPDIAYAAVRAAVPDENIVIKVADPDSPVSLI